MVATIPALQPLPVPADFPVTWDSPDDERLFWQTDRMHWPDPMTPLDFDFMRLAHEQFNTAMDAYGVPLAYTPRLVNYRWYYTVNPNVADMSEMPARMGAALANLEATIARLRELWDDEWLPEVQQHLAYWEGFDLPGTTMAELIAHLDETIARHNSVWKIHFLQTLPVYMAMSTFDDLYQDLLGVENGLDAYRLMQGLDNKTVEMGRELWRLSRQALASSELTRALDPENAAAVVAALATSAEGRAFLADFERFLDTFGRRGQQLGVSFVSWLEDPTPAIRQLREYVSQPELDAEAAMAALVVERDQALALAREAIAGYPRPIVAQFERMLEYARAATIISEDHNHYIDYGSIYQVRQVLLELGRRFAMAGVLEQPDDVFLLTLAELRETSEQLPPRDRRALVAARKAEMAHVATITPPPALGTLPSAPPPDDPLSRTIGKFFGRPAAAPEVAGGVLVIHGGAGSAGTVRGTARVIETLADAGRLGKGDILVAPTTAPAWTPLFATAAAIVTDTGGVLSHSAVVAREYHIPAVVGAAMATALIQDGQLIEVAGDNGIVRILAAD